MKNNMFNTNDENKISIIIPMYNIEQYVERCIRSVVEQSYENLEIILVDDGSVDNTPYILDEISKTDNRIRVIHKENGGVTSARIRGIEESTGNWIGFVDGDDYIENDMYERLLKNALQYHADISHCGYKMVFPNRVDYYYNSGQIVKQEKMTGLKDLLEGSFVEPGLWNKLYHKSLFSIVFYNNKIPESIRINEDLLMNYWLFKAAKYSVYEDFCPYHYMVRKGSAANSGLNEHRLKDPIRVAEIIAKDSKDMKEINQIAMKRLINQWLNALVISSKDQKELILPFQRTIRKKLRSYVKCLGNLDGDRVFKLKVLLGTYLPVVYRNLHTLYAKVTGIDRKYYIE